MWRQVPPSVAPVAPGPDRDTDPTELVSFSIDPDLSDLSAPTRPSFPAETGFDELPPVMRIAVPPPVASSDAESATVRRPVIEQRRPKRRPAADRNRVTMLAAKSGLAGLLVGLLILVPITLVVIWSQY